MMKIKDLINKMHRCLTSGRLEDPIKVASACGLDASDARATITKLGAWAIVDLQMPGDIKIGMLMPDARNPRLKLIFPDGSKYKFRDVDTEMPSTATYYHSEDGKGFLATYAIGESQLVTLTVYNVDGLVQSIEVCHS